MQRRTGGRGLGAVLFTDIVGSTTVAAELGNSRWGELVSRHHRLIRREIRRFGGREQDTAGDGFFAAFERPIDAIRCAVAAVHAVRELGIEIRAGVSFGQLEMVEGKAGGLIVNTAARVGDAATDMAPDTEGIWVGDLDGSLYRVGASALEVTEVPLGAEVLGVAVEESTETTWVSLGKAIAAGG